MANEIRDAFDIAFSDGPSEQPDHVDKAAVRRAGRTVQSQVDGVRVDVQDMSSDIANLSDEIDEVRGLATLNIQWKEPVRAAASGQASLGALINGSTVDGITMATGDRVLLMGQTTPSQNGIYIVAASGSAARATDADTADEVLGMAVFVREGTSNAGKQFICVASAPITLGTTALPFRLLSDQSSLNGSIAGKLDALPELISFDRKWRVDQRGIVDGTARIYIPRRFYYRRGANLMDVDSWGTESTRMPGFVEKPIPNTAGDTIYIYLDLDAASDPIKVAVGSDQPPTNRPGRIVNLMSLWSRGYVESRVDYEEVTDTGGARLVPRFELVVDAGKLLVPMGYYSDFDANVQRQPSDGSLYWEADIPQTQFGPDVTSYLWDDVAAAAGNNPIRTIANTQTLEGGIKFPLIARALNGRVSSDYTMATSVPNLWDAGSDPDNCDWIFTNCFVADSPSELAAAGFPRCVRVAGSNNCYYGGELEEPTVGGEYVFARVWVHTDIADDFGTPILYMNGDTATAQQINGRLEKRISSTLAIFQYAGRMNAGVRAVRYLVGCLQNDQGASKIAGGQFWIGAQQGAWISRLDHTPVKGSMRPTIGKNLFMVQGRTLPLYLDNIIGAHDDLSLVTGGLWSIKAGSADYPYMAEGERRIIIDPDKVGATARVTTRRKGVSGRKTMRFEASVSCSVAALPKTASPKILMIGDSLTNRQMPTKVNAKLTSFGLTPTWLGTVNSSGDETAAGATGPLAEGREGIEFAEYVYAVNESGTPGPVTNPASYIAADKATKITLNPFLRAATGGDPSDRVFNGYIFDFAGYMSNYSVSTPDVVLIGLGTNDRGKRAASVSPAQAASAARAMILQIRAGAPLAKIGWWMPAAPRTHLRDEDWAEHISIIRAVMAAIYALADANVFVIPAWAHMSPELGWRLDETNYAVSSADNVRASVISDEIHLGVGAAPLREQAAEVLAAFIANVG